MTPSPQPSTADDQTEDAIRWSDLLTVTDEFDVTDSDNTSPTDTTSVPGEEDELDFVLLGGIIGLIVVLIIGMILIVCCYRRCCRKKKQTSDAHVEMVMNDLAQAGHGHDETVRTVFTPEKIKITKQYVCKAMQKLLNDTWIYDEQRIGNDASGLGHYGMKLKKLYRLRNSGKLYEYTLRLDDFKKMARGMPEGRFPQLETKSILANQDVLTAEVAGNEFKDRPCTSEVNELYLFHGTAIENVDNIIQRGFSIDKAYQGLYGKAVYFSDSAMKADQYADQRDNRRQTKLTMFVVRVILGDAYPHTADGPVNALPCVHAGCKTPSCGVHRRYDSLVAGRGKRFKEFLMYETTRCYPQYLIEYDRVTKKKKKKRCCDWT